MPIDMVFPSNFSARRKSAPRASLWAKIWNVVRRISREHALRRELESMSDRALADVGISRAQLMFEYERHVSQRPLV
jgi:uncharacterized protein YjiS (DUF1127 family)